MRCDAMPFCCVIAILIGGTRVCASLRSSWSASLYTQASYSSIIGMIYAVAHAVAGLASRLHAHKDAAATGVGPRNLEYSGTTLTPLLTGPRKFVV